MGYFFKKMAIFNLLAYTYSILNDYNSKEKILIHCTTNNVFSLTTIKLKLKAMLSSFETVKQMGFFFFIFPYFHLLFPNFPI